MNILIVSATEAEIRPVLQANGTFDTLITGVGMVATAYRLTKKIHEKHYDLIINMGVAGSFNPDIAIGEVVQVSSDCFADFGAEDDKTFLDIFQLELAHRDEFPFKNGQLLNPYSFEGIRQAAALTVNKVHGNDGSIENVKERFSADIESMEGAAFFYVCLSEGITCLQLRSISNYVEKRDRSKWNLPLAIENLNKSCLGLLPSLSSNN